MMAIVQITVDTETKSLVATIDGTDWGPVDCVSVYKHKIYDGEERVELSMSSPTINTNGTKTTNRTCVYASLGAKEKSIAKKLDNGLADIKVVEKDYEKAIAEWIKY